MDIKTVKIISFTVFSGNIYIPTPAFHEVGSTSCEPVHITAIGDIPKFVSIFVELMFSQEKQISLGVAKQRKSFVEAAFTGHKNTKSFVAEVDSWNFGPVSWDNADYRLIKAKKYKTVGFTNYNRNEQLPENELFIGDISTEISQIQAYKKVAEFLSQYYSDK